MPVGRRTSEATEAAVVARYRNGDPVLEIAADAGVAIGTVYYLLR